MKKDTPFLENGGAMRSRPSYLPIVAMLAILLAIAMTAFFVWRASSPVPIAAVGAAPFSLTGTAGRAAGDTGFRPVELRNSTGVRTKWGKS